MQRKKIIVVGAGLSGLSAAVELIDENREVVVLESRAVCGGRTSSWIDKRMQVESGLHRFLGFYEALPRLMERVGKSLDEMLIWEDEIEIRLPDGAPSAVFSLSPLHKPFASLGSILGNNDFISPAEKAKLGTFFAKGFVDLSKDPDLLDQITVYNYAKNHGLDEETILRVLVPLTEGLFFLSVKKYSAYQFFALFKPYITKLHKTRVGAFRGGMTEVMVDPIIEYISHHKGTVKTDSPVTGLYIKNDQVRGVRCEGKTIEADHVILATSLKSAQTLLKGSFTSHQFFMPMLSLKLMPSVTFQIELTKPSMPVDRTTFSPGTFLAAYAEQSRSTFRQSLGRISLILAHPEKFLHRSADDILETVLVDAKRIGLDINKKIIKNYRKIVWPHDFYTYEIGSKGNLPSQKTPINGLSLAGDYTDQEYLQTMEGAVVSGIRAANACNESLG